MMRRTEFRVAWPVVALIALLFITRGTRPGGASPAVDDWVWSATGSMSEVRYGHTATLLADGRVLVAGGVGISDVTASAETYDPATGAWSPAGSMSVSRAGHTATRLADGRVLVIGGHDSTADPVVPLKSAELFDPATGAWSATRPMTDGRDGHAAALLPDGSVLVIGGRDEYETKSFSARYDPTTDTWTWAGAMKKPRAGHTATTLIDGRVLVVGGYEPGNVAELYDPEDGEFLFTGGRGPDFAGRHTAVRLDDGRVYILSVEAAAVYDPISESWDYWPSVGQGEEHAATLMADGRVLVSGGVVFPTNVPTSYDLAETFLIDPATGEPELVDGMVAPRSFHTATTLLDGRVLVAGGSGGWATAEIFAPFMVVDEVFVPVTLWLLD